MKGFFFEKFLYTYMIFLFFIVFVIGLGAGDMFGGNIASLTPPTPPSTQESAFPISDWLANTFGQAHYFVENVWFFFQLMSVDTGVAWIGTLIMAPAAGFILYGMVKLARGGG